MTEQSPNSLAIKTKSTGTCTAYITPGFQAFEVLLELQLTVGSQKHVEIILDKTVQS